MASPRHRSPGGSETTFLSSARSQDASYRGTDAATVNSEFRTPPYERSVGRQDSTLTVDDLFGRVSTASFSRDTFLEADPQYQQMQVAQHEIYLIEHNTFDNLQAFTVTSSQTQTQTRNKRVWVN